MADETGTKTTRPDAAGIDDSLFGDAADEAPAAVAEEQDSAEESEQDGQGPDDPETDDAKDGAPVGQESATETEKGADADEDAPADGLKVVVSIKGARATIGVQQPSSDAHIESFDSLDESGLAREVSAVIERARARWEEAPKHPAYERPAPPARRRNRRGQETAQAANAEGDTESEQAQQQTLRLF